MFMVVIKQLKNDQCIFSGTNVICFQLFTFLIGICCFLNRLMFKELTLDSLSNLRICLKMYVEIYQSISVFGRKIKKRITIIFLILVLFVAFFANITNIFFSSKICLFSCLKLKKNKLFKSTESLLQDSIFLWFGFLHAIHNLLISSLINIFSQYFNK